jgi:hypothetical protein
MEARALRRRCRPEVGVRSLRLSPRNRRLAAHGDGAITEDSTINFVFTSVFLAGLGPATRGG